MGTCATTRRTRYSTLYLRGSSAHQSGFAARNARWAVQHEPCGGSRCAQLSAARRRAGWAMVSSLHARRSGGSRDGLTGAVDWRDAMNVFSIPPGTPFLDALAAEWLGGRGGGPGAIARGLILFPTRRA